MFFGIITNQLNNVISKEAVGNSWNIWNTNLGHKYQSNQLNSFTFSEWSQTLKYPWNFWRPPFFCTFSYRFTLQESADPPKVRHNISAGLPMPTKRKRRNHISILIVSLPPKQEKLAHLLPLQHVCNSDSVSGCSHPSQIKQKHQIYLFPSVVAKYLCLSRSDTFSTWQCFGDFSGQVSCCRK